MPELPSAHPLHYFGDRFVPGAAHDLAGHHIGDGCAKHRRPFLAKPPDNIALRDDPDDAVIGAGHDQCTNAPLCQHLYGRRERRGRFDSEDLITLLRKYVVDCHGQPPCASVFRERVSTRTKELHYPRLYSACRGTSATPNIVTKALDDAVERRGPRATFVKITRRTRP